MVYSVLSYPAVDISMHLSIRSVNQARVPLVSYTYISVHSLEYWYIHIRYLHPLPSRWTLSSKMTTYITFLFRRRLSAEGAKPESNNRWKSELGHVCMYVCTYVCGWVCMVFGIISRTKARSATNENQNGGLRNGHCLGTVSSGCDF